MKFFTNIIQKIKNTKAISSTISSIVAFLSMLTIPNISFAQNLFTPVGGDLSVLMLNRLFGGLIGTGGADPLLDLITTFNGAVLTIGGILVAYTIFAGTIGTAHDGQMLGKKFSSVWVPLRTAMGTALVIPINGYCGMQYIVMWLVLQGIGLADTVWISAVSGNSLQTAMVQSSYRPNQQVTDLANNIFRASVCTVASNLNDREISNKASSWGHREVSTPNGPQIYFGNSAVLQQDSVCGHVNLINENVSTVTYQGQFSNVNNSLRDTSNLDIVRQHNNATRAMVNELYAVAQNFVQLREINNQNFLQTDINTFSNQITTAVNNYSNRVANAVQSRYNNLDNGNAIAQNAAQEGWIMAGAWFMKIANQMSLINAEINNVPTALVPTRSSNSNDSDEVNKVLLQVNAALARDPMNAKNLGISKQNDLDKSDSIVDWFGKVMAYLGSVMTGVDIDNIANSNGTHPLLQAKAIGDRLITASLSFIGLVLAAAAAIGMATGNIAGTLIGAGSAATSAILFVSPIVFTIFGGMLGMGWFLSFYIPMMPFMIWMGALVGWFIMVVEAIFAAPLWAVMHLHPNGDDVTGRGGNGYMLVLGLLVRPTLMIFGLLAAIILSMVLGEFLNTVFFEVFKMSRNGESLGPITMMFALVMYISVFATFVKKMFDVIHIVPDQLLQWIGGGGSQLGQYAGTMLQGTQGTFTTAGAALGNVAQQGLPNAVQSVQNALQRKAQRDQTGAERLHQMQDNVNSSARGAGLSAAAADKMVGVNDARGKNNQEQQQSSLAAKLKATQGAEDVRNTVNAAGGSSSDQAAAVARYQQAMENSADSGAPISQRVEDAKQLAIGEMLNDQFAPKNANEDLSNAPSTIMNATAGSDSARQAMASNKLNGLLAGTGRSTSSPAYQEALSKASVAIGNISSVSASGNTSQIISAAQSAGVPNASDPNSKFAQAASAFVTARDSYNSMPDKNGQAGQIAAYKVQEAQQHMNAKAVNSVFSGAVSSYQSNIGSAPSFSTAQESSTIPTAETSAPSSPQMELDFGPPPNVSNDNDKQA